MFGRRKTTRDGRKKLLYGVTIGLSARTLLADQLEHFAAEGYEMHLVCAPDERLAGNPRLRDVRIWPLAMERDIAPLQDLVSLARWVATLLRIRPDIVNLGTPKAALLGALAARLTGVPKRVYVVWGLRFEGEQGRRRQLLLFLERVIIECVTDVVVVSESVGHEMIAAGLDRRPLKLIGEGSSNGVRGAELREKTALLDRDAVRSGLAIDPGAFVVGYIGRVTGDKGLETLARAVNRLSERGIAATLLIVGSEESRELAADLRELVPDLILTGWSDEPWRYFPAMDVFCLPTHREGFPNVVLEAASCGVPVVTTNATGARDSVLDGQTGLRVDVGDDAALADAFARLQADPGTARRLAAAAQFRALNSFQPQRIWRGIQGIYEDDSELDVRTIGDNHQIREAAVVR